MTTVYRIPKYLEGTKGKDIFYKSHWCLRAKAYTDVDWAGSKTEKFYSWVLWVVMVEDLVWRTEFQARWTCNFALWKIDQLKPFLIEKKKLSFFNPSIMNIYEREQSYEKRKNKNRREVQLYGILV